MRRISRTTYNGNNLQPLFPERFVVALAQRLRALEAYVSSKSSGFQRNSQHATASLLRVWNTGSPAVPDLWYGTPGEWNIRRCAHARYGMAWLDPGVFNIYPGWRDYLQTLVTLNQVRNALMRKEQPLIAKIKRKLIYERQIDNLPW